MYMHMYMVAIVTERNTIVNSSLATINLSPAERTGCKSPKPFQKYALCSNREKSSVELCIYSSLYVCGIINLEYIIWHLQNNYIWGCA
jgi:hypothetical protein